MTRVFVLADSKSNALDLATLLAEDDRLELVGASAARDASISALRDPRPDVILAVRITASDIPDSSIPVVMLTGEALHVWEIHGSVKASLPAHSTPQEIFAALLAAAQGLTILTPAQAEAIVQMPPSPQAGAPMPESLTPRETQVLRMMAEGLANKEIAGRLGISDHTAKFHVASILSKLQAGSRTEAVTTGIRTGLIPV